MYWCCGRMAELAPGCAVGPHESNDDEEQPEERATRALKCSSCKEVGHEAKMCPYDPNARLNPKPNEEIERLAVVERRNTHFNVDNTI